MRPIIYLYAGCCAAVAAIWLILLLSDPHVGIDFYPLYMSGHAIRAGASPYGAEATAQLSRTWDAPFAAAGVAYPLPLLLLVVPLSLLPFTLATGVWVALGSASSFSALRLNPGWRSLLILPLIFLPFYRSVALGQATLVWFGLAVLLVSGILARRPWLVGMTSALLLLKPQNGLLFALAGLIWAIVAHRRALWWFIGSGGVLAGLAFLLEPGWLLAWLAQVELYRTIVAPPSLLPGGLVLLLAVWRLPWWARLAAAQVVLFPLSDFYSTLPLLLCWVAIGGPLALAGAAISWVWPVVAPLHHLDMLWLFVLWPLIGCAAWRAFCEYRTAGAR